MMGYNYCEAFGYDPDDLILLSPTVNSMKMMLRLCENYALEHSIKFNVKKSQIMLFPSCKKNEEC